MMLKNVRLTNVPFLHICILLIIGNKQTYSIEIMSQVYGHDAGYIITHQQQQDMFYINTKSRINIKNLKINYNKFYIEL
jgi:hypothetical protein